MSMPAWLKKTLIILAAIVAILIATGRVDEAVTLVSFLGGKLWAFIEGVGEFAHKLFAKAQ